MYTSSGNSRFYITLLLLFSNLMFVHNAHVKGSWNTHEFFKFIIKFGFRQSDIHKLHPAGFVHGMISSNTHNGEKITFSVLNDENFSHYYSQRHIEDKELACKKMFENITVNICGDKCCNKGDEFLSGIKGKNGGGNAMKVVYEIKNYQNPRFWYLSFVSCYQDYDSDCAWRYYNASLTVKYDLWLVNGHPNRSSFDPFVYQFSFDQHDTTEIYLLFFALYGLLLPIQIYAMWHQIHPVTKIFTISVCLKFLAVSLFLVDSLRYALDGVNMLELNSVGDVLDILSKTTFMLVLLLLAKGWAVTRIELSWHPVVFIIWLIYAVVNIILYFWTKDEIDIAVETDEFLTLPGLLIICLRFVIIVWFVLELRNTMKYEHNSQKLNFFLHFGASALVWFIYLPAVDLISLLVPPIWRFKLILGVVYAVDYLAYCVMTHLLWPTRSEQYFLLASPMDNGGDELDVFNEAPHILNNYNPSGSPIMSHSRYAKSCDHNHYA